MTTSIVKRTLAAVAAAVLASTLGVLAAPQAAMADSGPLVSSVEEHIAGLPLTLNFAPGPDSPQVVEYRHWFGSRSQYAETVPAAADGTASTVIIVRGDYGVYTLNVVAVGADGVVSAPTPFPVTSAPAVTITSTVYPVVKGPKGARAPSGGIGVTGDFIITRLTDRLTEVSYSVDGTVGTVPFGPDGTATVMYTPTKAEFTQLWVMRTDSQSIYDNLRSFSFWPAKATGPLTSDIIPQCMHVSDRAVPNRAKVQSMTCQNIDLQTWSRPGDGTIRAFGKCVDVTSSGTADGTKVQMYTCNGTGAQQWTYQAATRTIVNPQSGKCLEVPNSSLTNGIQLQIWTCNGTAAQRWMLPG
ncbi:ricin-type beta-trefoil lectin domain protein [Micromonospora sp. DT31]|uniref:ricin-type beta-trefoil lectin domain protein n=1 Tax=Micromonospora sp. DT31 TaxID=3393434 RepID=UPI003CF9A0E2